MFNRIIYKQNYIKQYKTELFQAVCCRTLDNLLFLSTIHLISKTYFCLTLLLIKKKEKEINIYTVPDYVFVGLGA